MCNSNNINIIMCSNNDNMCNILIMCGNVIIMKENDNVY